MFNVAYLHTPRVRSLTNQCPRQPQAEMPGTGFAEYIIANSLTDWVANPAQLG